MEVNMHDFPDKELGKVTPYGVYDISGNNGWVTVGTSSDTAEFEITVCHYPPGTSKWNKIEHRMFSHITRNWRGRPLESHEVVVSLIANTTTRTGLKIRAELDKRTYVKGIEVSRKEVEALPIEYHEFHGNWNYTVKAEIMSTS